MAKKTIAFDVSAIIGSMPVSSQVKRAYLKVTASSQVKKEIGVRIIERIVERTHDLSIDKDGDKFKKYAVSYAGGVDRFGKRHKPSLAFQVYGKSKNVTLTLSGAMLSSLKISGIESNVVSIGFSDKEQFAKASGHIDGTGANNSLPVRDFWGLPLKDVQDIIKGVIKDAGSDGFIEAIDQATPQDITVTPEET